MEVMREMMGKLKLAVNEKKTKRCTVPEETFDFLGFTFGPQTSWKTKRVYVTPKPSKKKIRAICDRISEETSGKTVWREEEEEVGRLNRMILGWANYFRIGYVTAAWKVVQKHT